MSQKSDKSSEGDIKITNTTPDKKKSTVLHDKLWTLDFEYKTRRKHELKNHVQSVHERVKNIYCGQCDYRTGNKYTLKNHIKAIHDKIKDISCGQCDYKTGNRQNLQRHVKAVHHKVKDIACEQCDYKTSHRSALKRHVKALHEKSNLIQKSETNQYETNIRCLYDNTEINNEGECQLCEFVSEDETKLTEHLMSIHVLPNR